MKKENNSSSGGLSVLSVIQIVFLILRIAKIVDWSWLLIFSPTIAGFVIAIILVILYYLALK